MTVIIFDVSFPEKLLKIVATRGEIFSVKFTKYRLAAGLRPDPLGELKLSPDPLAAIRGPTSKGRGREGKEREWRGREGRGEGEGEGTLLQGVRG